MKVFPTLNSLKQKLNIQKLNTGKILTTCHGLVHDDRERLHAILGTNGCVHLKSGTEFSMMHYRGQNEDFGKCVSTLNRCNTQEEQFLNICRTVAFEELIDEHPFVKFAKTKNIANNPLCINNTGIAQHYGLHTNYIDITTNFDVASFFATCEFKNGKYIPIGNIANLGVIYVINELLVSELNKDIKLEYLGWQPLPRPEQQRASVIKTNKDMHLEDMQGIEKHYFKQSIHQSKKIWKQFNEGKLLFPKDSTSDIAESFKELRVFTQNQVDKSFERFENWSKLKLKDRKDLFSKSNISIVDNKILSWNCFTETKKEYWENKFYKMTENIGYRFAYDHFQEDIKYEDSLK